MSVRSYAVNNNSRPTIGTLSILFSKQLHLAVILLKNISHIHLLLEYNLYGIKDFFKLPQFLFKKAVNEVLIGETSLNFRNFKHYF